MNAITAYYLQIANFIKSLTIKIDEINKHQNYHMYVKHHYQAPTDDVSKYYQNICGIKNLNDYDVFLDSKKTILLTRENINIYHNYKKTLLEYGKEYDELCFNNPGMSDYIRGCLLDIELNDLLEMENYKIVSYDKSFIKENEIAIINELESFIKIYMDRYSNKKYIVEELYMASFLSNLYHALFLKTISLKVDSIFTYKADTFHRDNFFKSYKNINSEMGIFNLETNIWLYGNLKRMKTNIGKNNILNDILLTVFDNNKIGVNNIHFKSDLPTLLEENITKVNKEYYEKRYSLLSKDANKSGYSNINEKYEINRIENIIIKNDLNFNELTESKIEYIDNLLTTKNNSIDERSKLFLLNNPEKINSFNFNTLTMIISNFINIKDKKLLTYEIDFRNINDFKIYKLSFLDIEYIIIGILYKLYGIEEEDFSIKFNGIYKNIDIDHVLTKTIYGDKLRAIIDFILNNKNLKNTLIYKDSYKDKFKAIREIDIKTWYVLSNIIDNISKTDIRNVYNNIFINETKDYKISEINKYLEENKLFNFIDIDSLDLIIKLLEEVSGLTIDFNLEIINKFKKIISFFKKTTSYTIDLMFDDDFLNIYSNNNRLTANVNLGYKPLMNVKDSSYKLYDDFEYYVKSTGFLDWDIRSVHRPGEIDTSYYSKLPCLYDLLNIKDKIHLYGKYSKVLGKKYTSKMDVFNYTNEDVRKLDNANLLDSSVKIVVDSKPSLYGININSNYQLIIDERFGKCKAYTIKNLDNLINYQHLNIIDNINNNKNVIFNKGINSSSVMIDSFNTTQNLTSVRQGLNYKEYRIKSNINILPEDTLDYNIITNKLENLYLDKNLNIIVNNNIIEENNFISKSIRHNLKTYKSKLDKYISTTEERLEQSHSSFVHSPEIIIKDLPVKSVTDNLKPFMRVNSKNVRYKALDFKIKNLDNLINLENLNIIDNINNNKNVIFNKGINSSSVMIDSFNTTQNLVSFRQGFNYKEYRVKSNIDVLAEDTLDYNITTNKLENLYSDKNLNIIVDNNNIIEENNFISKSITHNLKTYKSKLDKYITTTEERLEHSHSSFIFSPEIVIKDLPVKSVTDNLKPFMWINSKKVRYKALDFKIKNLDNLINLENLNVIDNINNNKNIIYNKGSNENIKLITELPNIDNNQNDLIKNITKAYYDKMSLNIEKEIYDSNNDYVRKLDNANLLDSDVKNVTDLKPSLFGNNIGSNYQLINDKRFGKGKAYTIKNLDNLINYQHLDTMETIDFDKNIIYNKGINSSSVMIDSFNTTQNLTSARQGFNYKEYRIKSNFNILSEDAIDYNITTNKLENLYSDKNLNIIVNNNIIEENNFISKSIAHNLKTYKSKLNKFISATEERLEQSHSSFVHSPEIIIKDLPVKSVTDNLKPFMWINSKKVRYKALDFKIENLKNINSLENLNIIDNINNSKNVIYNKGNVENIKLLSELPNIDSNQIDLIKNINKIYYDKMSLNIEKEIYDSNNEDVEIIFDNEEIDNHIYKEETSLDISNEDISFEIESIVK